MALTLCGQDRYLNGKYKCDCGRIVTIADRRKLEDGRRTHCGTCERRLAKTPAPVHGAAWIPLTQGKFALIDKQDIAKVRQYCWYALKNHETWYALRNDSPAKTKVYMHHVISGHRRVDHTNGDGLDNRRNNLRSCTKSENAKNRRKHAAASSSFKGVTRTKNGRWQATIYNGKAFHLGTFHTEEGAASAYDRAAKKLHGAFASPNRKKNR